MYFRASARRARIFGTSSTVLLDTFMVPRITFVFLKRLRRVRSLLHQASSILTASMQLSSRAGAILKYAVGSAFKKSVWSTCPGYPQHMCIVFWTSLGQPSKHFSRHL